MKLERIEYQIDNAIVRHPKLAGLREELLHAAKALVTTYTNKNKLLICGNGGSAADADHIVGELMKSFCRTRPLSTSLSENLKNTSNEYGALLASKLQTSFPCINLTQHTALTTAFQNDVDPSMIFAQQVLGYGNAGDIFWGISTSGNSKNIVYAAVTAKAMGLTVLGMTGAGGGQLTQYSDILLAVPEIETYKIQELHLPIYHALCLAVEDAFFF